MVVVLTGCTFLGNVSSGLVQEVSVLAAAWEPCWESSIWIWPEGAGLHRLAIGGVALIYEVGLLVARSTAREEWRRREERVSV